MSFHESMFRNLDNKLFFHTNFFQILLFLKSIFVRELLFNYFALLKGYS